MRANGTLSTKDELLPKPLLLLDVYNYKPTFCILTFLKSKIVLSTTNTKEYNSDYSTMYQSSLLLLALLLPLVPAHFQLAYPPTVGFSDEDEGTGPCGGVDVTDASFSNATDFHVDGDAIALTSTHPHSEWLFRATLDRTAASDNFTNLLPTVSQTGLGAFCEPDLTVPAMWAGSMGVLQIQQVGSDGSLYQVRLSPPCR